MNSHGFPDHALELQAIDRDLLPPVLLSTTLAVPVPPAMTLTAFASIGYVRVSTHLRYVLQPAAAVPLSGANGTYWLALHADTHTPVATWTRVPGTHYLWCSSGSQPATPDGALVFASVTVAGGVITVVTPLPATTPLAAAWRTLLGLGTMAQQDASAVAITGGGVTGLTTLTTTGQVGIGAGAEVGYALRVLGATHLQGDLLVDLATTLTGLVGVGRGPLAGTALAVLGATLLQGTVRVDDRTSIGVAPESAQLTIGQIRGSRWGGIYTTNSDAGGTGVLQFKNAANAEVGYITTNATTTTYATASDVRLKRAVQALSGALDALRALRPVSYRWNADDSVGHGFLAHELQQVIPEAVMGEPDAVNADGSVKPQGVDHSKLVPWLTAALKETLAQVEALTARVALLEEQLGV